MNCFVLSIYLTLITISTGLTESDQTSNTQSNSSPIASLKAHDSEVRDLLKNQGDTLSVSLKNTLKSKINETFDFFKLSELALNDHWVKLSKEQRQHFVKTFSNIIREQNFDTFLRYYREGRLRYDEEKINGETATVKASVPLDRETITILYSMHLSNKNWLVYDISIDGASTVESNRRRYDRYIKKHSYEKLVIQLEKQLDRLENTEE